MHSSLGLDVGGRALDFSQGRIPCLLSSRVVEGEEGMGEWEEIGRREESVNNSMRGEGGTGLLHSAKAPSSSLATELWQKPVKLKMHGTPTGKLCPVAFYLERS